MFTLPNRDKIESKSDILLHVRPLNQLKNSFVLDKLRKVDETIIDKDLDRFYIKIFKFYVIKKEDK